MRRACVAPSGKGEACPGKSNTGARNGRGAIPGHSVTAGGSECPTSTNRGAGHSYADHAELTLPTSVEAASRITIEVWGRTLCANFKLSFSRNLTTILGATAAGAWRSGTALPIFLPRGIAPGMALQFSGLIYPVGRFPQLKISPIDRQINRRAVRRPKLIKGIDVRSAGNLLGYPRD